MKSGRIQEDPAYRADGDLHRDQTASLPRHRSFSRPNRLVTSAATSSEIGGYTYQTGSQSGLTITRETGVSEPYANEAILFSLNPEAGSDHWGTNS
jgi:hypothetical protein